MGSSVIAANGDHKRPQGHCSQCGKIWTLETWQGICQWCRKPATCQTTQTKPRHTKSSSRRKSKQDNGDGNGNGYDLLQGEWLIYYKVGKGFERRVRPEDREDFLHDLFLAFARVKASYNAKGRELTEGGLVRIAQYEVAQYWRNWYRGINGTDCGRCSTAQRQKCKEQHLYRECPKAIKIDSLDTVIEDGNGDSTPLYELIADDNAVDVVAMLDARHILAGYPHKAVKLAYKRYAGYQLDKGELEYLSRFKRRMQKRLI